MIVIRIFYVIYFKKKINLKFKLGFRIYDDYLW